MALKFDISYIHWIKAAFCAGLRALFGPSLTAILTNSGGIDSDDTELYYTNMSGIDMFVPNDTILIDDELCIINQINVQQNKLIVTRGACNTIATSHINGSYIIKAYVPEYLFLNDEEKTKILIYTGFPNRNFNSPIVVVNASSGNAAVSSIGPQEELGEKIIDSVSHLYFSGILRVSIEISIFAMTLTDVEKLIDFIIVFLRFFLRDKLAELNVAYTDISVGEITTTEWRGQLLYTSSITISNCHSQYELVFPKSFLQYINQLNIEINLNDIIVNNIVK